jgi:hypothetical protein
MSFFLGYLVAHYTLITGCIIVSEGCVVGKLQNVANKGVFIKTLEGELNRRTDIWFFSVTDIDVENQIMEIFKKENRIVSIDYKEYYFKGVYESHYRATNIEELK